MQTWFDQTKSADVVIDFFQSTPEEKNHQQHNLTKLVPPAAEALPGFDAQSFGFEPGS